MYTERARCYYGRIRLKPKLLKLCTLKIIYLKVSYRLHNR